MLFTYLYLWTWGRFISLCSIPFLSEIRTHGLEITYHALRTRKIHLKTFICDFEINKINYNFDRYWSLTIFQTESQNMYYFIEQR